MLKTLGAGLLAGSATVETAGASSATDRQEQLETVERAIDPYTAVGAALEDGFVPGGPYVPGMGWHFTHPGRLEAAAAEGPSLEEPPILTYADTGDHVVLGAAEWAVPLPNDAGITEESPPDLFDTGSDGGDGHDESDDGDESPGGGGHEHGGGHGHWAVHEAAKHLFAIADGEQNDPEDLAPHDFLTRGRWTEVPADREVEAGDEVAADWGLTGSEASRVVDMVTSHPDILTLHAWTHIPNPEGTFAHTNPNLELVHMLPDDMMAASTAEPGSQ